MKECGNCGWNSDMGHANHSNYACAHLLYDCPVCGDHLETEEKEAAYGDDD